MTLDQAFMDMYYILWELYQKGKWDMYCAIDGIIGKHVQLVLNIDNTLKPKHLR